MAWKVRAEAPTRVDLAGGTLDLWPVHFMLGKAATINVAVTLEAQVEVTPSADGAFHFVSEDQGSEFTGSFDRSLTNDKLPLIGRILQSVWTHTLPTLHIRTKAKSPAGAGLGGSSCLAVTLEKALWAARRIHEPAVSDPSEAKLVRTAQDAEALIIKAPTGCQDYWGAVRGGVNIIRFPFGGETVETLPIDSLKGLKENLILCYSGKSRASATNNWVIFKKTFDGDDRVIGLLSAIGEIADQTAVCVKRGDLAGVLACSEKEWQTRKKIWPDIVTEETEKLDQAARSAGATFARVCGAGGGGVMAIFAPPEAHSRVIAALEKAGGRVLDAGPSAAGLTVQTSK